MPYLLNDVRNFNEIFVIDLTYNIIILKVTKNLGFILSLEDTFLKKTQRGRKGGWGVGGRGWSSYFRANTKRKIGNDP